jgi:guanosine-diphosphatase
VLICGFIFFTLILSPSNQRTRVLSKAGQAWEQGWEQAEDYWEDHRKAKDAPIQDTASAPPKPKTKKPVEQSLNLDDVEPHRINLPPMHAGDVVKEASILEAVREKPALHADKTKTTRCESNGGTVLDWRGAQRPVVQYYIMIDAGSTGSRVHVYKFNFCTSSPELEDEVFQMLQGGLSSYKSDARGAALSLKPLLETALKSVPASLQKCTPIAVKATAGLRLLGAEMSLNILKAVRDMLEQEYPFPIADGREAGQKSGVEIMAGRDEGVFAWITVNYLLNRIGSDAKSTTAEKLEADKVKTAAVMDLGGASTQIVFEPVYESSVQGMYPGEHVYELSNFGGKKYTLYQNSYLGFGLMEARKSINSLSFFTYGLSHPNMARLGEPPKAFTGDATASEIDTVQIPSPCFAEGKTKKQKVRMQGSKDEIEVTMVGTAGGFEACRRLVEVMMDKDA